MKKEHDDVRQQIIRYGLELYERHLTDAAGGNLSVRVGDELLITPRYAGNAWHWNLRPEQILTLDLDGNKLDGEGEISREAKVHLALLRAFYPQGTAVLHTHARNILVFCAMVKPMPPVLHATEKFGEILQIPDEKAHSQDLADAVLAGLKPQADRIPKGGAAVMAPKHGLFVIAKDLIAGFDTVERLDTNAYCLLHGGAIGGA